MPARIKQRGSIMVAFILSAIYRQFLRNSLPGIRLAAGEPSISPLVQAFDISTNFSL
jgi:hypothetical protein